MYGMGMTNDGIPTYSLGYEDLSEDALDRLLDARAAARKAAALDALDRLTDESTWVWPPKV